MYHLLQLYKHSAVDEVQQILEKPIFSIGCFHLLINLLYKAEKPSVRLSVLSVRLRHGIISVVSARIDLGLGLCIAESFET